MHIINLISYSIIPILITIILAYAIIRKVDIYTLFIEGAKEGINTAFNIMPYMIAIFIAIGFFKASGALEVMEQLFMPLCDVIRFPKELLSLFFIKPISGSGGLGVVNSIIEQYGADTYIGRTASVMMGSAETIFYTMAVYFGVTSVKNGRHVLVGGLIAYIGGVAASVFICKYI